MYRLQFLLLFTAVYFGVCPFAKGQILKFSYLYEYTKDAKRPLWNRDYRLCVEWDGECVISYSENNFLRDSTGKAAIAEGDSIYEAQEKMNRYPRGVAWVVIGNLMDGTFVEYNKKSFLYFKGNGKYERPQWTILEESGEDVCGFACKKAVADYYGRTWTVWYTEEIPLSLGPWLLWGSPGFIMKAEEKNSLFRFTCEEITQTEYGRKRQIEDRYESEKYKLDPKFFEYSLAEMEQIFTKVSRDPKLQDEMQGGFTEVYDADGNKVEINQFPYIPLIAEEYWKKK